MEIKANLWGKPRYKLSFFMIYLHLYRFFRPVVSPTEIGKIEGRCDGQAVEIGLKERCQDDLYEH